MDMNNLKYLIENSSVENIDAKLYSAIVNYSKNRDKFDDNIKKIINKLIVDFKNDKLTIIDKWWLYRIINERMSFDDIENIVLDVKKDAKFFINNFVYVKNKFEKFEDIPDILKKYAIKDIIKFVLYEVQEEFLDAIVNNKNVVAVKSRQTGGTTTAIAYLLWFAITNNNKDILILSKTDEDAKKTLAELKFMFNYLPFFLKKKVIRNNERLFSIGKETLVTNIRSLTSGKNAGRSISASIVVIDEVEFIQNIEELYKSIVPTLSATNGKLILISTPYMYNSFFHRIIQNSDVNGFKVIWFYWWRIPYRDKNWYENECKKLNYDIKSIKTELNCEWIIPYKTFIDDNVLLEISKNPYKPLISFVDEYSTEINIYESFDDNSKYLMSVDTKEYGNDYNAFTIFKIDKDKNIRIVAEGRNRKPDFTFINTIFTMIAYYPTIRILFERNRAFAYIEKFKEEGLTKYLIHTIKEKMNNKTNKVEVYFDSGFGIQTTKANRNIMFSYLSKYVNENVGYIPVLLFNEIKELIIKENGKIEGLNNDDVVMSASIGLYFIYSYLLNNNQLLNYVYNNDNSSNGLNRSFKYDVNSIVKIIDKLNLIDKINTNLPEYKYIKDAIIDRNIVELDKLNDGGKNSDSYANNNYDIIIREMIKNSISEKIGVRFDKKDDDNNDDGFLKRLFVL